jgi:isocitrate/isopropylmalate dehydrogenase
MSLDFSIVSNPVHDIRDAERVHAIAKTIMDTEANAHMEVGLRAARAKDRGIMAVLERIAELVNTSAEAQYGETVREIGRINVLPVEAQVWRRAYEHALEGKPDVVYAAIYGAAAVRAGLVPTPRSY